MLTIKTKRRDLFMDHIATGNFIAKKRKEQNFTQQQLAERLGASNKTISKWETGVSPTEGY